jgi:hypothetical protein
MDMRIGGNDDIALAAQAKRGSPFLNTKQAAYYLNLSPRTLEDMRSKGYGPKVHYHGRNAAYLVRELDEWSAQDRKRKASRRARHRITK